MKLILLSQDQVCVRESCVELSAAAILMNS